MVPREYSNECMVARETSCHIVNGLPAASQHRQKTLDIGRIVWTTKPLVEIAADEKITAYADGVGPIELDPRALKPF